MTAGATARPAASPASRASGVLIVGGGTVGHLAPGFAVAEALRERGVRVAFATPGEARERDWFPPEAPAPHVCPALRLPRRKILLPLFVPRLVVAVARAWRLLSRVQPGVVLALGGWPCVPAALAAWLRRIPIALVASDAKSGVAVKRLLPLARRLYVVHESAAREMEASAKVVVTGPVVRAAVRDGEAEPEMFGLVPGRLTLFVTGGSLGAQALNEALTAGIGAAVREDPSLAQRIQVLHSVGLGGEGVAAAYAEAGIVHHVTPFVRAMGTAYRTADLVVCRAGALTCAELRASGTPAVLVPYPHHPDRQQFANARPLVECGGALLLEESELTVEGVRRHVLALLEDAPRRRRMAGAICEGATDGAGQTADDLIRLFG